MPSSLPLKNKQYKKLLHERLVSLIWPVFLHELTNQSALPISLLQALADNDDIVDETFELGLDNNSDDLITASEDDGEYDDIINDLHGGQQDAGIWSVVYFSVRVT